MGSKSVEAEGQERWSSSWEKLGPGSKVEKNNKFTQQLINSRYTYTQTKNIILSSLKGTAKKEIRRKGSSKRYRSGSKTLKERMKKKTRGRRKYVGSV